MVIYHNPRCRKSRETLKLLEDHGLQPEIRLYLDSPPDTRELRSLVSALGIKPFDLVRTEEDLYKEHWKGKDLTDEDWLDVLATHPRLIQRPIVVNGRKAVLGRPPEAVLQLI